MTWAIRDALTITQRSIWHWQRQPYAIIFGLLFPIMLTVLFGYLFGGAMQIPGGGSYMEFMLPGMFVMVMAFGIGETMVGVAADREKGVTDRFRSMPMASSAVVLGRAIADMLYSAVLLTVMLGFGLLVGWSAHNGTRCRPPSPRSASFSATPAWAAWTMRSCWPSPGRSC